MARRKKQPILGSDVWNHWALAGVLKKAIDKPESYNHAVYYKNFLQAVMKYLRRDVKHPNDAPVLIPPGLAKEVYDDNNNTLLKHLTKSQLTKLDIKPIKKRKGGQVNGSKEA